MNLTGQWYNSAYAGEGFYLTEQNGRLIGAYFTYAMRDDERVQAWYVFDCERDGDLLSGVVTQPQNGIMGSTFNAGHVTQPEVGVITFTDAAGLLSFVASINGIDVGYDLVPLFGVAEPDPDPQPDPDPDPDPEDPPNPFDGVLTFRIKPFNWLGGWLDGEFWLQDGTWYALWSTAQIFWKRLKTGRNTVFQLEITALQQLTFLHTSGASGYGNPSMEGIPNILAPGEKAEITFKLDKAAPLPGSAENGNFQINTDLGTLVLYTAHIMGGA